MSSFFRAACCFLLILLSAPLLQAQVQNQALAQEYYRLGEYEKAATLYEDLMADNPNNRNYYQYYYNSMMSLQEYDDLEKVLRKRIKKNPQDLALVVDLGYLYDQSGDKNAADEAWTGLLNDLPANRGIIVRVANSLININEYDYATKVFERGKKLLKDQRISFNYELANLYARKGDIPSMVRAYLDYLEEDNRYMNNVQNALQRHLDDDDDFDELQAQLYERIQRSPNDSRWSEVLIWNFIQLEDYESAFTQVKALDRRENDNGTRVYNFAVTARVEEEWDACIQAFNYLVRKGPDNIYYFNARNGVLNARRAKILSTNSYSDEDLQALKNDYESFLSDYNRRDARAAATHRDLAYLQAFYIHDLEQAIALLENVMAWPGIRAADKAEVKLDLGDYYLMDGEIWEASLLYSQVDKSMKDEPLGEEARFKNARLSYYNGDFDWAQGQLTVLKASTSELVANDALRLSVFITENLGLDSSTAAMERYSRADLLAFQNRHEESIMALDSLEEEFPGHFLADDIIWLRANIAQKERDYEAAALLLETIRTDHSFDILADDALYNLGELYEFHLNQPDKAMECYQSIMLDHKDSVFVVEARKRFRALRGDDLN